MFWVMDSTTLFYEFVINQFDDFFLLSFIDGFNY